MVVVVEERGAERKKKKHTQKRWEAAAVKRKKEREQKERKKEILRTGTQSECRNRGKRRQIWETAGSERAHCAPGGINSQK